MEVPQAKAIAAIHAITGNGQQEMPLRSKQAGLYITDTRCSGCDNLVELGDVGYEDELCNDCVDEATERYWGPPYADRCTEGSKSGLLLSIWRRLLIKSYTKQFLTAW